MSSASLVFPISGGLSSLDKIFSLVLNKGVGNITLGGRQPHTVRIPPHYSPFYITLSGLALDRDTPRAIKGLCQRTLISRNATKP